MSLSNPRLLDLKSAADRIGLPPWRIYELVESRAIPCRRVGRRIYFTETDLSAALDALAQPAIVGEGGR